MYECFSTMMIRSVKRRRVGRAARARAQHDADLRDDAGILRIAAEDFGVTAQAAHALLNARAAGIDQADDGHAVAQRQIHHAANLVALHFAERAAVDREVLRVHVHRAAVDLAVAGDHAFAQILLRRQAHLVALMRDERFELVERAVIEQPLQPFARGELAFGVLFGHSIGSAADAGLLSHAA